MGNPFLEGLRAGPSLQEGFRVDTDQRGILSILRRVEGHWRTGEPLMNE